MNNLTGCQIAGIVVGAVIVIGILMNVPDIAKWIKLKSM
jgi:hypothetical protein